MKRIIFPILCGLLLAVSSGCSKKKEVPPPPPVSEEPVFPMKQPFEAVETIPLEKLNISDHTKVVRADFNMDKLEDIALIEEDKTGQSSLSIYLRKKTGGLRELYYKAVGIQQDGDYTITALMSRRGEEGTDLIVIINYPDNRKEMVHYRSDGKAFHEVDRHPLENSIKKTNE